MSRLPRRVLLGALLAAGAAPRALAYDAAACPVPGGRGSAAADTRRRARAAVELALAQDLGVGAQAAVMRRGQLLWSDAVGLGATEPDQALTRGALMRIGSVSKLFTAVAAARLHAEGRLDLDAPIQTYVPEFPTKARPITARQLATHTSGLRHYNFRKLSEGNNTVRYGTLADALRLFADDPLVAEPGAAVNYSSFGFNLLGVAVERASGRDFDRAITDLVARPLGLAASRIDDPARDLPCRTEFFTIVQGARRSRAPVRDSSDYYPSGGMLSTADDLARLAEGVFVRDRIPPAARKLARTPARLAGGPAIPYTFGWQVELDPAGRPRWYGHGGTTNGAYASLRHYPASGVTIAVTANYNLFLNPRPPAVLRAAREDLPRIFGAEAA